MGAGAAFEKSKPLWHLRPPMEDKAQAEDRFVAASPGAGGNNEPVDFSADDIKRIASGIGYRVDPKRLDGLASGLSRLIRQLEALDDLDIDGCERAETINLLELASR
ncbi:MAG: hypothetical protein HN720_12235 [Nitrospinaceae bacterium]|nr:hypothetical protein [Nitrospinaceae bacterium]